jgi:hypothetical protein
MGIEVEKLKVPESLGPVPAYDPEKKKRSGGGNRNFKGKKNFKKPFHKNKPRKPN